MVEFIAVDGPLEPRMEVFGSVGFQVDSVEEQRVEGAFELFPELDVGGIVLLGILLDNETGFLSVELVNEFVGSGASLVQGVQPFEGNLREIGGFVGVAEFLPKVFVLSKVGESISVGLPSCDPGFGPEGGTINEVGDNKQDSLFFNVDGLVVEL
jgi:hypothetical protein